MTLFPAESVAALFCMSPAPRRAPQWESPYRAIAGVDVWDRERDATKYKGPSPVVAHPPCRAWGKLQYFAKPREGERALALYALACVHRWGGVLEHPEGSELWNFAGLPKPEGKTVSRLDARGGFTVSIQQWHFGHRCEKPTWIYVCGIDARTLPAIPFRPGKPEHAIAGNKSDGAGKGISHYERMHTPPALAEWLVSIARRCSP